MPHYLNTHRSQYGSGNSTITRTSGCTWTSAANGADAQSGGAVHPTPDQVHALVDNSEETSPKTPGWSLGDADLAMSRLHVPFEDRSHKGWPALVAARRSGLYILLQGDSDRFGNQTCSGAFDGDHCIGLHPDNDASGRWRIDDPICPTARYEYEGTLLAYASKFDPLIRFGVFTNPVPVLPPDTSTGGSMKFQPVGQKTGVANLKPTAKLYRISDGATISNPPLTRNVYGEATWSGVDGYVVTLNDEAHLLKKSDTATYTPEKPDPVPYPVKLTLTIGGKPVSVTTGPLTLP